MKKIVFIFIVILAQSSLGQTASKCEPVVELLKSANNTKAVACEEINKNGRCEEPIPVDADAIRKGIESDLKFSTNPSTITRLQGNWETFIKANPRFSKFYAERNSLDLKEKRAPVPILDWFSDPAFASDAKTREEYKKAFVDKYVAFAEKYDCKPTFYSSTNHVEPHPTIKDLSVAKMGREEQEFRLMQMKKELNDPVNVQAVAARMKKLGDNSLNTFHMCTTRPDLDSQGRIPGRLRAVVKYPPCAGNFTQNFDNNKYDVSEPELSKLLETKEAQDVSACIKSRLAQGAKLHHISITSSASALNNTQEAKKRFCEKGFLALSEARAETARKKILPGLFGQTGQESFDFSQVKVETNASGANGDGTSGDCPYTYTKSGQEVLKPYYKTKAGQEELDENRFEKVQVTFEDSSKGLAETDLHYQPMYRCKKIDFKCE